MAKKFSVIFPQTFWNETVPQRVGCLPRRWPALLVPICSARFSEQFENGTWSGQTIWITAQIFDSCRRLSLCHLTETFYEILIYFKCFQNVISRNKLQNGQFSVILVFSSWVIPATTPLTSCALKFHHASHGAVK